MRAHTLLRVVLKSAECAETRGGWCRFRVATLTTSLSDNLVSFGQVVPWHGATYPVHELNCNWASILISKRGFSFAKEEEEYLGEWKDGSGRLA